MAYNTLPYQEIKIYIDLQSCAKVIAHKESKDSAKMMMYRAIFQFPTVDKPKLLTSAHVANKNGTTFSSNIKRNQVSDVSANQVKKGWIITCAFQTFRCSYFRKLQYEPNSTVLMMSFRLHHLQ